MRCILALVFATMAASARADEVMAAVRADRWAAADAAAAAYADPVAAKLVTFYRLLSPQGGTLAEIAAFVAENPDWPQQAALLRRRDEAIPPEPDDALVARTCDQGTVTEAAALERCAEVYGQLGRAADAATAARKGWVASTPDPARDTALLARWVGVIGPVEQRARFIELAWTDTADATRQLASLTPDDRRAGEALLALRRDDAKAATMLATLPESARVAPDMLLETARWLRRANRDTDAVGLWRVAGAAAERDAPVERRLAFWDERNILLRRRLKDGDPAVAYALADDAQQVAPEPAADAAFMAGWIALRALSDPARALPHFRRLAGLSRAAITHSRAEYWLGRTLAGAGDAAGARAAFAEAAAFPNTFYGQLAALTSGDEATLAARIREHADPGWRRDQALAFAAREPTRAAAYLVAWNEPRRAAGFLLRLTDGGAPADLALSGRLALEFGAPETAVAIARRAGRDGVVLLGTGWPTPIEVPATTPVEPPLVLAISRQESSFDATTTSPVGARGLMQLMPGTAAAEAKALDLPLGAASQSDPAVNVRLGSAYLRGLLDRYAGSIPLAVAAYNAGPSRVDGWITANGDPRNGTDMVDWIESIGFGETRNYVERVLENLVVYRALLHRPGRNPLTPAPGPA